MAYRVELTDRALRDLSIIYERIRAESSEQATRWFDRFEKAIFSLEKYPNRAPL
jgi:toxin ParE1/3/4